MKNNKNLVLLFGGESSEHEASLKMFEWMYSQLKSEKLVEGLTFTHVAFIARDGKSCLIKVDFKKNHSFYSEGRDFLPLIKVLDKIREKQLFIYSLLQGQNAEDGRLQGTIELLKIDASVGGLLPCALSQSKYHLNNYIARNFDLFKIPETVRLKSANNLKTDLTKLINREIVVKPNSLGGSAFASKISCSEENFPIIRDLVTTILEYDDSALVQEYVEGEEYACGCIEKDNKIMTLPIMKIETDSDFFGHDEKHKAGMNNEILLEDSEESELLKRVKLECQKIFENLDFQNMCRFDFLVKDGTIYFLEINSFPGLMKKSLLTQMLAKEGYSVVDLVGFCYKNFMGRNKKKTEFRYSID